MTEHPSPYGIISNTAELGQLVRQHRKQKHLTLEDTSGLANLSVRFLSEFERGKETAEIGKVLKALRTLGLEVSVQPRNQSRNHPRNQTRNQATSRDGGQISDQDSQQIPSNTAQSGPVHQNDKSPENHPPNHDPRKRSPEEDK